jgi:hypothetical protein
MRSAIVTLIILTATAATAGAQSTTRRPQQVWVTVDGAAMPLRGSLIDLSADRLTVLLDGRTREIALDEVLRIDVDGDPLRNGALIGAAIGGVLSAPSFRYADPGAAIFFTTANVGLWAALGAGIDALIPGHRTIYRKRPPLRVSARVTNRALSVGVGF